MPTVPTAAAAQVPGPVPAVKQLYRRYVKATTAAKAVHARRWQEVSRVDLSLIIIQ